VHGGRNIVVELGGGLGNQLFQYFAGILNQNKETIFCPGPPLKGSKSSSEIVNPEGWIRVQSEWT
jgi:hypothetical protein